MVRGAIRDEDDIGTGGPGGGARFRLPAIFADRQSEPDTVIVRDGRLRAALEIALFIEDRVVRQYLFPVACKFDAVAKQHARIVDSIAVVLRNADVQADAIDTGTHLRQGRLYTQPHPAVQE